MVDNSPDKLEWADPHCQKTECLDGDGRLIDWMGCSMQRSEDRRSLVEAGVETPHKLPGVVSCLPGLQMLLQEQEKHTCPLKMDNTSAVAYINKMGGTVSSALNNINKEFWLWCMERDISVQAQHLAGKLNSMADEESRVLKDRLDWMLCPKVFQKINRQLGPLEVDLHVFASRLSTQLLTFVSWRLDLEAMAADAFTISWTDLRAYANPPWSLVGRVPAQVQQQRADLVLIAPVWKSQPWYPALLEMCTEPPKLLPALDNLIQPTYPSQYQI